MSDEIFDEQPEQQVLDPNIRKQLRDAEKARKELEAMKAELEAERREVQFTKAGIPENGIGALFRKAYDGDASADSIRKAAEEYGILNTQATTQEAPSNDSELEALRRTQGATIGTSGAGPDLGQEFLTKLANADNPEAVMSIVSQPEYQNALGLWTSRDAR